MHKLLNHPKVSYQPFAEVKPVKGLIKVLLILVPRRNQVYNVNKWLNSSIGNSGQEGLNEHTHTKRERERKKKERGKKRFDEMVDIFK